MGKRAYYAIVYRSRREAFAVFKAEIESALSKLPEGWSVQLAHGWSFSVFNPEGKLVEDESIPRRLARVREEIGDHFEKVYGYTNEKIARPNQRKRVIS